MPWFVWPGAVVLGLAAAWFILHFLGPIPWMGQAVQEEYTPRRGEINWVRQNPSEIDPVVLKILSLGQGKDWVRWNSKAQADELVCLGVDTLDTVLINTLSEATLPDGWLTQKHIGVPRQVLQATMMLEDLKSQPAIAQALTGNTDNCLPHPSWETAEASPMLMAWVGQFSEEDMADESNWITARDHIRHSSQKAGLAQLVLSPGLTRPDEMLRVAGLLDLAGERLSLATGHDSLGLLGLNGRVAMTLLPTDVMDPVAGNTRTRSPAESNVEKPTIDIVSEDNLNVIMHEWFHSFDLGLAPVVFGYSHPGMSWMDQKKRLGVSVAAPLIHEAMKLPLKTYGKMKNWHGAQNQQEKSIYWGQPTEAMAYAFEWWAYVDLGQIQCVENDTGRDGGRPTLGEAACLADVYRSVFAKTLPALFEPESKLSGMSGKGKTE